MLPVPLLSEGIAEDEILAMFTFLTDTTSIPGLRKRSQDL